MSEVAMSVIAEEGAIHGRPHGSFVETVVAALAAEPETIAELEAALARFVPPDEPPCLAGWRSGVNVEPYDAGICIVDLSARMVATQSSYSTPGPEGALAYRDRSGGEDVGLRYHVSDDWLFLRDIDAWEAAAAGRRAKRQAAPPLDTRQALYGPVVEFIVDECLAARSDPRSADWTPPSGWTLRALDNRVKPGQPPSSDDAIAEIHARWLTTPREDLRGQSPRDVLLAQHDHISWDAQDRCEQWSLLRQCPPALDPQSAAFRFGGFGTHEIVLYYELVRHLVCDCWDHVVQPEGGASPPPAKAAEVARLRGVQDQWLNTPQAECGGRTPAEVIEHERLRLPEAVTGHDTIVDDDCPLCQMMAEGDFGPMFWHLDGCNMDDDFAFSFHRTRAEWEEERRKDEEFRRKWEEERKRRAEQGGSPDDEAEEASVWTSSFSAADPGEKPPTLALFGIGSHLAELGTDLRASSEGAPAADALNRHFGNLRDVVGNASDALLEPVVARFCQELREAGELRPELTKKCASLAAEVRQFAGGLLGEEL